MHLMKSQVRAGLSDVWDSGRGKERVFKSSRVCSSERRERKMVQDFILCDARILPLLFLCNTTTAKP